MLKLLQTIYERFQSVYWDIQAKKLHKKRMKMKNLDDHPLKYILDKYKPKSVLDVGCGSGRFFELYKERGVKKIVGIDISKRALEIARKHHPDVLLIKGKIEETKFDEAFDLAISNRTLQHVTKRNIRKAIENICECCKMVFINELTESDGVPERIVIYKHDYVNLFKEFRFKLIEKGKIGRGTWMLFSKRTVYVSNSNEGCEEPHGK